MPEQPRRHVASVGPARHCYSADIDVSARLQRFNPGHHIAPRAGAGVIHNRVLVDIADLIAASVVWLKDYPAFGGHQLCLRRKSFEQSRSRPAVNYQHERVFLVGREIGWISYYAVMREAVRLPGYYFSASKLETGNFAIQICQPLR